jgi:hypothetical protein
MKQQVPFPQLQVPHSCNALRQDVCKTLCDELNGIIATFPIFDELARNTSEGPDQLLKAKKFFIKAAELHAEKIQAASERKLRIQKTSEMVQVRLPSNTQTFHSLIDPTGVRTRTHSTLKLQIFAGKLTAFAPNSTLNKTLCGV